MKNIELHTAGGIIIDNGRVLLIKSASRRSISLPKGRVEPGESLEETAVREVLEETGYKTKIISLVDTIEFEFDKDNEHHKKFVTYFIFSLVDASEPQQDLQEGEDFENLWVTPQEAVSLLTYDDSREVLKKAIATNLI